MTISELKTYLSSREELSISLPDGSQVPAHFHITEVGEINKYLIDCGGTVRHKKVASMQLYRATDYDHRLSAKKLHSIITIAEREWGLGKLSIEVEYQGERTIEKYNLELINGSLQLIGLLTTCLAPDKCGIPEPAPSVALDTLVQNNACTPGSGCC